MSNTKKAFLFSVVFHVAVLAGLGMLRPRFELGVGASTRYLEISLAAAPEAAVPGTAADTDTPANPEPAPEAPAASGNDTAPPESAVAEVPAVEPPAPAAAAAQPPAPPPEPAASPPLPEPASIIGTPATTGAIAAISEPLPDFATDAADDFAIAPAPVPVTVPDPVVREEIGAAEAQVLTARIEDWADSFTALGKFGTTTVWEDGDGVYEATVTHEPSTDSSGYDQAVVTVSTTRDGRTLSTRVRMQRLGFSHYAQFIDRWDPAVQIHDDEIDGRFHANSDIFIQRSAGVQPTFLGKVTTARSIDTSRSDRRVDRRQVFLGGLETRVGRIPLPSRLEPFAGEPDADSVLQLTGDTELRFHADRSYSWSRLLSRRERRQLAEDGSLPGGALSGTGTLPVDEPFFIVAGEDSSVHVAGIVDGRVLVYTPEDIVIDDDLVYASHPTQSTASDDYLGLVAEGDVEIADARTTGDGDLEVHAAIYARDQFAVRGFRGRPSGELRVIGSITAGSLTATEPRFSTRLVFDRRLADTRPPAFPLTDRFEIADWDGRWIVEP